MIKDLLKSMNDIFSDSTLNLTEKTVLIYLVKQFNANDGYAYPKYEDIMLACSINRRANISKVIKSLVAKGLITVKKTIGNKSHYFIEKYLYFVGDKAQEVNSNEKQNLTENKNEEKFENEENSTEQVKFTNSVNGSKVAKKFEGSKSFKVTKWFLDRIVKIDETIVDMVLEEKPKTAKLFLVKCIEKSLLAGLELSNIIKNTLKFYSKTDEDYANAMNTEYNSDFYMTYADKQLGLI